MTTGLDKYDIILLKSFRSYIIIIEFILLMTLSYVVYTMLEIDISFMMFIKTLACFFLIAFIYQTWVAWYYMTKTINQIKQEIAQN